MANLFGTPGNDILIGTDANDVLSGGAGDDWLDGRFGFDTLNGGVGNDTTTYDFYADGIIANLYTGVVGFPGNSRLTDTLISIENLVGSRGNDFITGNIQNNSLSGGLGNDTLSGEFGEDTLSGDEGNDSLYGGDGNDVLDGGFGFDYIDGGAGEDTNTYNFYTGGITADLQTGVVGFPGNSTSTDTLVSIENLIGSLGNDTIAGDDLNNILNGNIGNDVLEGRGGNDTLIGGLGDDTYIVNDLSETIVEETSGGIDTVNASVSYVLSANVENLSLTGNAPINGTGNALNNTLRGNDNNNTLNGKEGDDTLIGGLGNDIYIVNDAGDQVVEGINQGNDIVLASVSYTILDNIENLVLTESGDFNATGNTDSNIIIGNAGVNLLDGAAGNDILIGAARKDTLKGGTGADKFVFVAPRDGVDRILDFSRQEGDKIVLVSQNFTGLNPNNFQASQFTAGKKAKDANDRLIYHRKSGNLFYDVDGRGGATQIKIATLNNKPVLGANDFQIVASPIASAPVLLPF